MQAFFAPAVALMSRLNVGRKFVLLGLMSLVAMAVVVYSLFASLDQVINSSQRELHGLELIKPFPRVVQMLQQHRGISAALLGGDTTMLDNRASVEKDVADAFRAMEGKLPPGLASNETWRHIRADWEHLHKDGFNWTAEENFVAHTRLIERIQSFNEQVADDYALTLDPEINSYYLIDTIVNKLPHATELLGQLRAYCTGILAAKQATPQQQNEVNIMSAKLGDAVKELENNLDKAGRHNPALQGSIAAASRNISASAQQLTSLVASNILIGYFSASPADFFKQSTDAIDQNYAQLHETLLPTAKALIEARIARAESTLYFSVGFAALLFLMVAYFSVGISRAVVGNIRQLVRSARVIASGNFNERVDLDTNDELDQIGDSFNEMAFGFRTLLEASRENEAHLQDMSAHLEERVKERTVELELAQMETEVLLRRNQALMMTSLEGVHVMDIQGNIVDANDAFCRMLGYAWEEVLGLNVAHWDAQWSVDELRARFREIVGKSAMIETLHRRKDGTLINVEISVSGVELEGQNFIFALSRDITGRKSADAVLRRHKVIIDTAIDGFWITDMMGNLQEANEAYAKISGYTVDELVGMHISQLEALEQSPEDVHVHIKKIIAQGYDRFETRHRRKDGQEIDIEVSVTYRHESQQFFVFCRDITERKRAEEEIHNLAFYDALTRLPNRRLFLDRFGSALTVSGRRNNFGAVLFIDLDEFKALNDAFGHDCGDLLLIEVAARIKSCVREMDTAARFGGECASTNWQVIVGESPIQERSSEPSWPRVMRCASRGT